jgi:hypothetical protein
MRFVVDVMLGRLARWLRILGFDAAYLRDARDEVLVRLAENEERILLTKDAKLLERTRVNGYLVRSRTWDDQLREVIAEFHLRPLIAAFSRCVECNVTLVEVEKEKVRERIPPRVAERCEEFYLCPCCRRIYWMGTHVERMSEKLAGLLSDDTPRA